MRTRATIIAVVLVTASAILGAFFMQRGELHAARAAAAAPPEIPVVAGVVMSHDVPLYLQGVGTVIAYNTVVVRSQIQGQITRVPFSEGKNVSAGDLLAEIDPRPYRAQLDQVTATRDRDQAQLVNARADLDRYNTLFAKGWATQQLVQTQKAQVAQLQSAVKADEALIEAARIQLDYTRLTSPISGVTGVRQVDLGNIIHPTDPNGLVVVTQLQPISVIFSLPEASLPEIQQRIVEAQSLAVIAYSQNNQIKLDEGKLNLIDNEIAQNTGTIRLKAEFPNAAHRLWPGELINVRLLLDTRHNGLTVPAPAVQQGPEGPYVYVINADHVVEPRSVKVAQVSSGQALIDAGLVANEQVVVDGQYKLQPGAHVTVLQGKAAEQAATDSAQQAPIP